MKRYLIFFGFLFALISMFLCSGCYDRQIFENTAVIIYAGANEGSGDNSNLKLSFAIAESASEEQVLTVLSTEAPLMSEAISNLNASSEDIIRAGKIQNLIFSESLAKKGILTLKDGNRVAEANRFLADYAVTEGSVTELFQILKIKEAENGSYGYLGELLDNAASAGLCPNTRHHEFNIDVAAEGIDPILPFITYDKEEQSITVKGTALFHEDRLVATLDTEESRYLSLLTASGEHLTLKLTNMQPHIRETSLHITADKRKIRLEPQGDRLKIIYQITADGYFDVSDWAELNKAGKKTAVAEIEQQLGSHCLEVLSYLQTVGSDPFGIAAKLRGYHNEFYRNHDFAEVYQNAEIELKIKVKLFNQEH